MRNLLSIVFDATLYFCVSVGSLPIFWTFIFLQYSVNGPTSNFFNDSRKLSNNNTNKSVLTAHSGFCAWLGPELCARLVPIPVPPSITLSAPPCNALLNTLLHMLNSNLSISLRLYPNIFPSNNGVLKFIPVGNTELTKSNIFDKKLVINSVGFEILKQ